MKGKQQQQVMSSAGIKEMAVLLQACNPRLGLQGQAVQTDVCRTTGKGSRSNVHGRVHYGSYHRYSSTLTG